MIFDPFRATPILIRRILLALAVIILSFVSLWSSSNIEAHVSIQIQSRDYLIHFFSYCILTSVSLWALGSTLAPIRSRILAFSSCSLYGLLMELLQMLPAIGRSFSTSDLQHNALGALLAALLFPKIWWPSKRCDYANVSLKNGQ